MCFDWPPAKASMCGTSIVMARDYRDVFQKELPHPKMDALVESLKSSWTTGKKALIFVRRVKSVDELKRKLDQQYDAWLTLLLRERLPESVRSQFDEMVAKYRREKRQAVSSPQARVSSEQSAEDEVDDRGGTDTFFAWFFRGKGPTGVVSGANIQRRFIQKGTAYSTFFEDNYVMDLLGAEPGTVADSLAHSFSCPLLSFDLRWLGARASTLVAPSDSNGRTEWRRRRRQHSSS